MGRPPRPPRYHASSSPAGRFSSSSSTGSGASANAPSSVMCVPASPLTRDLSDLSGSYMNGNTAPRSRFLSHSHSVCSTEESVHGCWRQAHILSVPCRPPTIEQQQQQQPIAAASPAAPALIVVERNGVIELVKKSNTSYNEDESDHEVDEHGIVRHKKAATTTSRGALHDEHGNNSAGGLALSSTEDLLFLSHATPSFDGMDNMLIMNDLDECARIPILILLLDPGRKHYELMQLWVDPATDLVRDVLHTLQHKLSDKWRQDYDGLFQLRGSSYCQLVHILSIAKYDVRPRELWVAKPWSMAAKPASDLATDCIRQLRAGGLLSVYSTNSSSSGKSRIKNFFTSKGSSGRTSPTFQDDKPLTLSEDAMNRLHVPDGVVMKHHHACQFLSFRAPSLPPRVVGGRHSSQQHHHHNYRLFGSLLGSDSFDDASSQLSNPSMLLSTDAQGNIPNSSSSPSRRRQNHKGHAPRFSSQLPAVGEAIVSTNNTDTPTSHILSDLEATTKDIELDGQQEASKKMKRSLLKMLAPLNCASCKRSEDSKKDYDGFSSWCGDGSSSAAKNSISNNNDDYGRESPTSKGSGGEGDDVLESLNWQTSTWEGVKCLEDSSIISESAPLLSSSYANQIQKERQQHQKQQPVLARPTPFSRRAGKF